VTVKSSELYIYIYTYIYNAASEHAQIYKINLCIRNIQGNSLSPSGISDLCATVAGMVTPKMSMSTEGETLHFLSYLTADRYVHPAVSVLVVAQPSSEVLEGLKNYPVYECKFLPCRLLCNFSKIFDIIYTDTMLEVLS